MGTRFHLGLVCAALVAALGGCGRAGPADQSAPDTSKLNASAALVEASEALGEASGRAAAEKPDARLPDDCLLAKVRGFVGKPDQPATRTALAAAIGRHAVRWIKPGSAVTQDMRPDRLNVIVGEDGRISSLRCG